MTGPRPLPRRRRRRSPGQPRRPRTPPRRLARARCPRRRRAAPAPRRPTPATPATSERPARQVSTRGVRPEGVSSGPPVVAALWRAIDVLRPIALGWAAYGTSVRSGSMTRPWLAWAVLAVLAAWPVVLLLRRSRT